MTSAQRLSFLAAFAACLWLAAAPSAFAQSQLDMNITADQAARDAQTKLDRAVQTYRRQLASDQRRLFDLSQKRWEAYRKAACDFQASGVSGGTVQPMVAAYCWAQFTTDRLKVLNNLLTCIEGDLSCPEFHHGT